MKVFITGGTGYLGAVLVERLRAVGHDVSALARSDTSATRLREAGATPVSGSLSDVQVLTDAAAAANAVVWAASDYTLTTDSTATELAALTALLAGAAARTNSPFIYTSTGLVYGFDPADATEDANLPDPNPQAAKVAAEQLVLAAPGVSATVIRAGLIFGRGGTTLLTRLIQSAQANGAATYIGDGTNTWLPVHVDDLADLYLRALDAPHPGVFNAVGTVRFCFRELSEAIGQLTGTPAVSVPYDVAQQSMGPAARILTTTSTLNAAKARTVFGWAPAERSLLDDVRSGSYTTDRR